MGAKSLTQRSPGCRGQKAEQGQLRKSLRGGQRQSGEEGLEPANDTQAMRRGGFFLVSPESWHH